jgi:squalene-hopene/tetraprenyl-beta-curcumene cyclase
MGRSDHPVAVKGVEFIVNSVRPDGSWPIDTDLATWVTTLAVNALGDDLPEEARSAIVEWLLGQQYREVRPYTNAAPGGWAWTDLPGGVPDADDTPGAMLAAMNLDPSRDRQGAISDAPTLPNGRGSVDAALAAAARWLVDLQNRDGGFPTFCRGWGALPFDRSSPDITAHALRALVATLCNLLPNGTKPTPDILTGEVGAWGGNWITPASVPDQLGFKIPRAIGRGFAFLRRVQRADGSWLPLWFGNQHAPDDINPNYGTARVLAAFRDAGLADDPAAQRGVAWLLANQNDDGGWGGLEGVPSSVEETALAVEILSDLAPESPGSQTGLEWLIRAVEAGSYLEPSPIGFYFAKLWYFERLYPVIFTVGALRTARRRLNQT